MVWNCNKIINKVLFFDDTTYRISSYSFRGQLFFSKFGNPKVTVHKCAETIWGNTVVMIWQSFWNSLWIKIWCRQLVIQRNFLDLVPQPHPISCQYPFNKLPCCSCKLHCQRWQTKMDRLGRYYCLSTSN